MLFQGFRHFFAPKKVTKKGSALEKSNHFEALEAAQKKLAAKSVRAFGPLVSPGSNSFLLFPLPGPQNGDFSKASPPETCFSLFCLASFDGMRLAVLI